MITRHVTQTVVATVALVLSAGTLALTTAPAQAFSDDRFTLVVIPDTQSYTADPALAPTMGAQTQWIASQKDALSVAFVTHVGDLVESHPNVSQWQRASQYMKTLDDAGVPSAVLPGNHDMNVATGDAPNYDQFFPPSRYSQASWNSSKASYGGYYGQNLFGPDPANRGNKDSFSLFSASGLNFLLLSLEYDPPDDVLAWAQKVIDAHPTRQVILSTHSFIHTAGGRSTTTTRTGPGVNTPEQVWTKLVRPNCSIFMVVNGHWHDGDLGEARRTDNNACGKPVHQLLSNFQERLNGGDGWLRYYTFDPSEDTIEARTYSPTLDRFETDANSQFTLSYDMTPPTATDRTLIASGASWAWRYSNAALPAAWTGTSFDDTSWSNGPATLGFGSYGPTTNIDVPPPTSDRPRSAQFRRSFTVADPSVLTDITLTTRANDGIALYLNGTELRRVNLPTGTLTPTTYATAAPSNQTATNNPVTFTVPASALRTGTNTL
ncbi:metallophosphoesterase, partial [Aeromicrobium sp.]|uniref:metallophosphoesterase n=1 Tax=Aeromicrobium sp. TaxID=1871063 RepID=UPI003C402C63